VRDSGELVVVGVILGLFAAMGVGGWVAVEQRKARLARLRKALTIDAVSVSQWRILGVVGVGALLAVGSVPLLMAEFPRTPLMFLVSVVLAFAAVVAPFTFARGLTVATRLTLDEQALRFERRGARAVVVELGREFEVESVRADDEVLVLVEQGSARILFSYRQGRAFVTLPLTPLPPGWIREDERFTLYGEEAALMHERLTRFASDPELPGG
jgi:hypothetical protein